VAFNGGRERRQAEEMFVQLTFHEKKRNEESDM
jgi:hypothetical protein